MQRVLVLWAGCLLAWTLPLKAFTVLPSELPEPYLPEHPEWVELYWAAWNIAGSNVEYGTEQNGFVRRYMDAAFSDRIFQWDTMFITQFGKYGADLFPSIQSLDNFYHKQHTEAGYFGYICRELRKSDGSDAIPAAHGGATINPTMFAWCEWEHYRVTGDSSRFAEVLPVLENYYAYVEQLMKNSDGMYAAHFLGAGTDNCYRWSYFHNDGNSAGILDLSNDSAICLTSQQALEALYMGRMYGVLGNLPKRDQWLAEHEALASAVNAHLWNPSLNLYVDRKLGLGAKGTVKTLSSWWPLLAEVATQQRADLMVQELQDPAGVWRPTGLASLAADQDGYKPYGQYWRGGVWAPLNYMAITGLARYGHHEPAHQASRRYLETMAAVYSSRGEIYEYYQPDASAPGEDPLAKPKFVGWSGCGPIALLIEQVLGFHVDAPNDRLTWRIHLDEAHGINRLRFGDNRVSLRIDHESVFPGPRAITYETDSPFELIVHRAGETYTFQLSPPAGRVFLVDFPTVSADVDVDGDVDMDDFGYLQRCFTGSGVRQTDPACERAVLDFDITWDVDAQDASVLIRCLSGANMPVDMQCDD